MSDVSSLEDEEEEDDEDAVIGEEHLVDEAVKSFQNLKKMLVTVSGMYFEKIAFCYV